MATAFPHCIHHFIIIFSCLSVIGLTFAGQEEVEAFQLLHLQKHSHYSHQPAIGVSVTELDLPLVSSTVLAAESWLRSHVLAHYPSTKITTIVVGTGVLCSTNHLALVLPSVKNLYYSLTRWGMVKEIKVSAALSPQCFTHATTLKPLLAFLHSTSSAYTVEQASEISLHVDALKKLGFSKLTDIRVIRGGRKLTSLSSFDLHRMPNPLALAPQKFSVTPPDISPAPVTPPASAPDANSAFPLPHCAAAPMNAPSPLAEAPASGEELWCVAKPTVPTEKLQEALDYACGEGKADCEEIAPNGNCFLPDNAVAHASYAFNDYWQKTKQIGGSCNFDGAAVLITSDPSFLQCHFELK